MNLYDKVFGKLTIKEMALEVVVKTFAILENKKYKRNGSIMRQPKMKRAEFPDRRNNKSVRVKEQVH